MKVAKLQIKNFLSISEAELSPGAVTQIVGGNNNGKTSILRALEFAARGGSDGSLVKKGETEAEIIVELDDQTVIRRRIKADGKQTLDVKKGAFRAGSPQSMLDQLFGAGAFNPLSLLEAKKRTETLLSALPIVLTENEVADRLKDCPVPIPPVNFKEHGLKVAQQIHKYLYQRRAEANKDLKHREEVVRVRAAELEPLPKMSEDPRTVDQIRADNESIKSQIAVEQEKSRAQKEHAERIRLMEQKCAAADRATNERTQEIATLNERLAALRRQQDQAMADQAELESVLAELRQAPQAAGPDQEKIASWNSSIESNLEEINRRGEHRAIKERWERLSHLETELEHATTFSERLTSSMALMGDSFTADLIARANLPIKGLTFEDGEFRLEGFNIDNLSASRALKLSVAVARAVAGVGKLICIDGAEALDEETYAALRAEIDGDGFQYFITKVGESFEHGDDSVVEMKTGSASVRMSIEGSAR